MLATRRLLAASVALALCAAGGAATTASAAQIGSTIPCVANLGIAGALTLPLAGSGFTPNALVALRTTTSGAPVPRDLMSVRADGVGNIAARVDPPALSSDRTFAQGFTLLAIDTVNPANTATTTVRQVRFGFNANPSTGRPARRVLYTARGFLPGRAVWAHFRFGGVTRRHVRLGVASSPCGVVSRRMRLLPTRPRFGTWTIYMDQSRTFSRRTLLQARGVLVIRPSLTR